MLPAVYNVIPAKAGIQLFFFAPSRLRVRQAELGSREGAKGAKKEVEESWIPAFAGMTGGGL